MFDRNKYPELPKMQVGFIDFICLPLYKVRRLFLEIRYEGKDTVMSGRCFRHNFADIVFSLSWSYFKRYEKNHSYYLRRNV